MTPQQQEGASRMCQALERVKSQAQWMLDKKTDEDGTAKKIIALLESRANIDKLVAALEPLGDEWADDVKDLLRSKEIINSDMSAEELAEFDRINEEEDEHDKSAYALNAMSALEQLESTIDDVVKKLEADNKTNKTKKHKKGARR